MGSRLIGIIVKEFIHLKRDMLALVLALVVPVAMLFIFGWAINTDVKHVRTGRLRSIGQRARPGASSKPWRNSQYFDVLYWVAKSSGADPSHRRRHGQGRGDHSPDFGQRLSRQAADVQVIVDASTPWWPPPR